MMRFSSLSAGVHPKSRKNTADKATVILDDFASVRIPMNMHIGPACKPVVKAGESVAIGQLIGEPVAVMAVPIHSSISGTVKSVKKEIQSDGSAVEIVEIVSDGQKRIHESVQPPEVNDRESFIEAVRNSGLVGLGGAGFPTHFKLNPPKDKNINLLLINGSECEPFITSDERLCIEHADEIIEGINLVMKYLDIPEAIIGIEDNTPNGYEALKEAIYKASCNGREPNISVKVLPTRYPQGAEKVLIYNLSGRIVPDGGLPHDVHVLVLNVGTVRYIAHYLNTGMPLTRKTITLDGGALNNSGNFNVPVGASIADVINAAGGLKSEPAKVIMGGPMMGVAVDDINRPIIKNNNAILVMSEEEARIGEESSCIRCGRCVRACPMRLMPTELDHAARRVDIDALKEYSALSCIECGCCTYICPAKRYLTQNIRLGKKYLRQSKQKEASKS